MQAHTYIIASKRAKEEDEMAAVEELVRGRDGKG